MMEMMLNNNYFIELRLDEAEVVNGGGGPISNTINATLGTVFAGNSVVAGVAVGVLATPVAGIVVGAATLATGIYCIKNALD
ncbi:hypothetical protein PL321_11655 [Caloramator sp. mosi_1]|uniref:hypothetical protein n=1 Tax=Caloramator sp. mosi_1 TaxID=3023090 RepID=UPI002361ADCD|nr:hypothetical protein [Caloramator sp. mosi_1]WDC83398.1 hypothetical protein PL321_11655 [Caloramator sp. mosi_1]